MKWLTAIFVALLLGVAVLPRAFDATSAWIAQRHASVKSIDYIPRGSYDFSASRRRTSEHDWDTDPHPGAGAQAR
jgi:hypothetical protein